MSSSTVSSPSTNTSIASPTAATRTHRPTRRRPLSSPPICSPGSVPTTASTLSFASWPDSLLASPPPSTHSHSSHHPTVPPHLSSSSSSSSSSHKTRPALGRRSSSSLSRLQLDAALEREKFGLGDLSVSTSPYEEEITIQLSTSDHSSPQPYHDEMTMSTPVQPITAAPHTHAVTARTPPSAPTSTSSGASGRTPTPTPGGPSTVSLPSASSSRMRVPVPPSPLSRMHQSAGTTSLDSAHLPTVSHSSKSPVTFNMPESSPCFIHSGLDRHGSLQDWLKNKPSQNHRQDSHPPHSSNARHAPHHVSTHRHHPYGAGHHTQNHGHGQIIGSTPSSLTPSASASRVTSPTNGRNGHAHTNGYESDKSSAFSGALDDFGVDDDDEGRSLTRQLAETAQGVREMSRELGRTKVHSKISHVLIVTKARDNRLIKLTRELALYLMQKRPSSAPESATSTIPPSRPGADGRPSSNDRGMVVYVDAQLRTSKRFDAAGLQRDYPDLFQPMARRRSSSSVSLAGTSPYPSTTNMSDLRKSREEGQLRYWTSEMCSNSPHLFDFVITLGGDGTVLFTSWLFQKIVPPVLPFALGSLGFLTNFDFASYKPTMDRVISEGIRVNLRMRFTCTVYRAIAPEEAASVLQKGGKKRKAIKKPGGEILMSTVDQRGWEALEGSSNLNGVPFNGSDSEAIGKDKEIMCFTTRPVEQFEVLNDLVVDRGPSPYVSLLELFGDEHHLTTVQADGLTVSTPTGSTAYSLSAGGSLVHPQIPALLITPICPHTLSFRPMLLPDGMELRICVPYNSRSTAWASFDGRGRVELKQGDHIKITASKYPFPTVCSDKASTDWFNSISRTLRWNEREKQKSFVVVEEDHEPMSKARSRQKRSDESAVGAKPERIPDVGEEEDEVSDDDDEEEEDEFDIDDKSGGEGTPSSPSSPRIDPTKAQPQARQPANELHARLSAVHKSGLDTPDRYVTHCSAPPPLSQRHLIDALSKAKLEDDKENDKSQGPDIDQKDGEVGQRDNIRADPSLLRVDGPHQIPTGRASVLPSPTDEGRLMLDQRTARPRDNSAHGSRRSPKPATKAFAFFGQDDSASDMSDGISE